ncbi:MAG: MaoC family dehydratase N-terminal domain-containing protein [Candidatus Binatia bacterium]|nr:MaoC family dehydratase N-terminal domain-containing protein [Candidatus Binatia bacterium]
MSFEDIDKSLIGEVYDRYTYEQIHAEDLIRYARTLGIDDPIYLDEEAAKAGPHGALIAFPTYVVKLRGGQWMPPEVMKHMTRDGFDAGKDIELGVPIRAGDQVTAISRITEIYEKTGRSGSMWFVVFRQEIRNQNDELIANVDSRLMQRTAKKESA